MIDTHSSQYSHSTKEPIRNQASHKIFTINKTGVVVKIIIVVKMAVAVRTIIVTNYDC